MRKLITSLFILLTALVSKAQQGHNRQDDSLRVNSLNEVVVTGQFSPQSMKNSVYQVRVIGREQIRLRGATNLQSILSTELGMRFSNDLTLGTTDVELMGMSGQNVKILLDGVPVIDRGSTRESLGQIDINNVEKIEIVEGPMSVSYGSDALAGVINIITKKSGGSKALTVNARVLEETAGDEYNAFSGAGTHHQSLGLAWQNARFEAGGGVTRNFFGGWQGNATGRKMEWMPKEQYLPYAQAGYRKDGFSAWYRFNGTDETLKSLGSTYTNINNNHESATDQFYITKRWFHQLQSEYRINAANSLSLAAAYTDYSRSTQTTEIDLVTDRRTLAPSGNQDKSVFTTRFLRLTAQHRLSSAISLQHGLDINLNASSGERIEGSPEINDYAYFASSEIKLGSKINLRPGLRFIHNSVYDAPPVIPSVNTKFTLAKGLDLRAAYARGFRSPALRELYFTFFDASHSIRGNRNLKAETSDSFNAYLSYQALDRKEIRWNTTLGTFYNTFDNLITIGVDPADASVNTYLNVDKYKTTGFTLNNTVYWKNLYATLGFSAIGRYNRFSESKNIDEFLWTPEVNSNLRYSFPSIATSISLFLKYTGKLPRYIAETTATGVTARRTETESFTMADLTLNKVFYKYFTLNAGVKNLFGVTRLANTNADTGAAHSTGGAVPMSYGRSYFLGISAQITR
ncbi:MAG: TonB-dependent receptor [Leadbetterella sp.]|nr:TonB-dependent receptor [Leadbetterella sp.]